MSHLDTEFVSMNLDTLKMLYCDFLAKLPLLLSKLEFQLLASQTSNYLITA